LPQEVGRVGSRQFFLQPCLEQSKQGFFLIINN
jgi:hypothetical protein